MALPNTITFNGSSLPQTPAGSFQIPTMELGNFQFWTTDSGLNTAWADIVVTTTTGMADIDGFNDGLGDFLVVTDGSGGNVNPATPDFLAFRAGANQAFDFNKIDLESYFVGYTVTVTGFLGGVQVATQNVLLQGGQAPTTFNLTSSFDRVDEVRIGHTGPEGLEGLMFDNLELAAPPNSPATATNLTSSVSFTEDGGGVALPDIVVSDADVGETITATLRLSNTAAGAISTGTFGAATSTFNAGTGVWTVTGSVADTNQALAAAAFTPAANFDQNVTITTRIRDAENTGPADGTITLTATAVNDLPTVANTTQTLAIAEDAAPVNLFTVAPVVSDVDTGDTNFAVLRLADPGAGVLTGFGSGLNGVYSVTGTAASITSMLAGVQFDSADNYNGSTTVSVEIRDGVNFAPTGQVSISVSAVNDAPTATNLTQTLAIAEDAAATTLFTTAPVVTDVDAGATITATLTLANAAAGVLTGAGTGTNGVYTITGTAAVVSTALSAVQFDSANNYNGSTNVGVAISDGTLSAAPSQVTINVSAVNDAPTAITVTNQVAILENTAVRTKVADLAPADPDASGNANTLTVNDARFEIDAGSLFLKAGQAIDFETSATIALTLTSTDGALVYSQSLTVLVTDVNEGTPGGGISPPITNPGTTGDDTIVGATGNDSLSGGAGTDSVSGGEGSDSVYGNQGNDTLFGGSGSDTVHGGQDNDVVYGGSSGADSADGADEVYGGRGNDVAYGNGGDDRIFGGEGADTAFGGQGNDVMYGGEGQVSTDDGADLLYGGVGNDVIYGNASDDALFGNQDNDIIFGGQGNDFLHGGQGNDTLQGGVGNDTLNGGIGADKFVFATGGGSDRIDSFNYDEGDRLDLGGQTYTRAFTNGNTILTLGDGGTITLIGTDAGSQLF